MKEKLHNILMKLEPKCILTNDYLYIKKRNRRNFLLILVYINNIAIADS